MLKLDSSLTAIALFASAALVNAEQGEFAIGDFYFEIVMLGFFIAYLVIWYMGASKNVSVAKKWTGAHLDYLKTQFAHVGDGSGNTLVKDGPSDYCLYTTGRRNMQFAHWWINLYPRNDITTAIYNRVSSLFGFEKAAQDHVTVTMTLDEATCENFVFAVLPQQVSKDLRADRFDLKKFTRVSQTNRLPDNLAVSSESNELTDLLLDGKVGDVIREAGDAFNSLIITCFPEHAPTELKESYPKTVTIDFNISDTNAEATTKLVQLVCELPDILNARCRNFKTEIKNKLRKNREDVQKEYAKIQAEERAEELAKKKTDAKKAEEERIRKMSPAEQRKWEEKERAKELKKSQKKRSKKL
ncbi:unnamed protein product [Umbelopsis vinacea]